MNEEYKKILEQSSNAIEKLQEKVDGLTGDLSDDASALWQDMKKNFSGVSGKLKNASKYLDQKSDEANLKAHLGAMEAHDTINDIKESIEEFTTKVSSKAQTELDTAALRSHLAKKEAEDFWEKKGKTITKEFSQSSEKVQELAVEAASEIKNFFEKLTDSFSKKS